MKQGRGRRAEGEQALEAWGVVHGSGWLKDSVAGDSGWKSWLGLHFQGPCTPRYKVVEKNTTKGKWVRTKALKVGLQTNSEL